MKHSGLQLGREPNPAAMSSSSKLKIILQLSLEPLGKKKQSAYYEHYKEQT